MLTGTSGSAPSNCLVFLEIKNKHERMAALQKSIIIIYYYFWLYIAPAVCWHDMLLYSTKLTLSLPNKIFSNCHLAPNKFFSFSPLAPNNIFGFSLLASNKITFLPTTERMILFSEKKYWSYVKVLHIFFIENLILYKMVKTASRAPKVLNTKTLEKKLKRNKFQ